jgi:LytS/YehU family sensor histidine kinase
VDFQVSETAMEHSIPGMILQPVIENSIRHGVGRKKQGNISIFADKKGSALLMTVTDNGNGIAPGIDPFTKGLGLRLTRERLHILYGEAASISLSQPNSGGLRVDIVIPDNREVA